MGAPVVAASTPIAPAIESADNKPQPPVSRKTKDGRTLWYQLRVIQQPERARACGSGPKSSADRRPVDPPPVVELRIFEGHTFEEARNKDITFLYNANFFLYATLEHARAMAQGRMQTPSANIPPVLTGMPVSGMAYLDRPEEAGYFLFPDLSVRHEGRYRLIFNLYEETKEDKDRDPTSPDRPVLAAGMCDAAGGSFDFRMELKSQDFIVYSAKKFPGLTESTNLSRLVAEQGCRVRIRRDVRMRRRDGKSGNNGGDYDNNNNGNAEDEYGRRRRTETPENSHDQYRARSMSGSAERTPYSADSNRRSSQAEYAQFPPTPSSSQHLGFLGGSSSSQYPPQPPSHSQQSSVPPSPSYPPPPTSGYPSQAPSYPPPPPPYQSERPPSQSYGTHSGHTSRGSSYSEPQRKSSISLPPLQHQSLPSPSYNGAPRNSIGHPSLPPLTGLPSVGPLPAMTSPSKFPPLPFSAPAHAPLSQLPPPPPYLEKQHLGKRGRDASEIYGEQRRQNGDRDTLNNYSDPYEGELMGYKRADGRMEYKTPRC